MHSLSLSHRHLLPFPLPPLPRSLLPRTRSLSLIPSAVDTVSISHTETATETPPAVITKEDRDSPAAAFWDYQFLFLSQRTETPSPVPLRFVSGSLPADFPRGTYYLTGPGLFSDDHGSTVHPLDGHGYLRAFNFADGEVRYSARYVKTEAEREEREEGEWRFSYRGPFSVLKGGRRVGNVKVMKNVANTSVVRWGGRLMCMWEGGDPYEIEEGTLDTVGKVSLVRADVGRSSKTMDWRKGLGEIGVDMAAEILKPILHGKSAYNNNKEVAVTAPKLYEQ